NAVFLDYRVEYDSSGARMSFSICILRIDPVNNSWRHNAGTHARRHIICNRLIELRVTQTEFNPHFGCCLHGLAASLAWAEFPLADGNERILVETKTEPVFDTEILWVSVDTDAHFQEHYSLDATIARFIAV